MTFNSNDIIDFFDKINNAGVEYVLLRNIGNELPYNFKANKDIDILVRAKDKVKFYKFMKHAGWTKILHPEDASVDLIYLYAMDRFNFFTKKGINIDICYQLSCRSTNRDEWLPLDQFINDSVWANRKKHNAFPWYEMSFEDELVHLVTRCVFDKKIFANNYNLRILELLQRVDQKKVIERFNKVFFKFTNVLLTLLEDRDFENIRKRYLEFIEY